MDQITFRTAEPTIETPKEVSEPIKVNDTYRNDSLGDIEPIKDPDSAVLMGIGITDDVKNLPESDQANLKEVSQYVNGIIKAKNLQPTQGTFQRVLADVKNTLEIDPDTEPSQVLDRIAGIVTAWRDLAFIKDPKEKRSIFMKLAKQSSSKDINRSLMEIMERSRVWQ